MEFRDYYKTLGVEREGRHSEHARDLEAELRAMEAKLASLGDDPQPAPSLAAPRT